MALEALFINGVYESVLEEILQVQAVLPDQVLFLQPYKSQAMVDLEIFPPRLDDPKPLFVSTTTDLATVRYRAEIVGWEDKRALEPERHAVIDRIIKALQPKEGGLYDLSTSVTGKSVNLLHVRRLEHLAAPFGVDRLINVRTAERVSPNRTQSGGWIYVRPELAPDVETV